METHVRVFEALAGLERPHIPYFIDKLHAEELWLDV